MRCVTCPLRFATCHCGRFGGARKAAIAIFDVRLPLPLQVAIDHCVAIATRECAIAIALCDVWCPHCDLRSAIVELGGITNKVAIANCDLRLAALRFGWPCDLRFCDWRAPLPLRMRLPLRSAICDLRLPLRFRDLRFAIAIATAIAMRDPRLPLLSRMPSRFAIGDCGCLGDSRFANAIAIKRHFRAHAGRLS